MYNIGMTEYIIIALFILLVFGAKRLPEMGKSLGLGIKEFKKSLTSVTDDLEEEEEKEKEKTSKIEGKKEEETAKES